MSEDRRPQKQVGNKFLGYRAMRNHNTDVVQQARTAAEAMELVNEKVSYNLEWRSWGKDPDGHEYWMGGDPRALAYDDITMSHAYLYNRKPDPDPNIQEELGHARLWDRYYVEAITEPILEDIPGARFIGYLGYYVMPSTWYPGRYDVRIESSPGLYLDCANSFPSREEAMAWAWNDIVKQQRRSKKMERPGKWTSFINKILR
jgi:hypothetical protein